MAKGPRRIVLLDDHFFRGDAVAAFLSQQAGDLGLELTHVGTPQVAEGCSLFSSNEVVACIYVTGGWSIGEPQVLLTLRRCLAALEEQPLIVLADEIDAEGIAMAIDIGVRGVISTRMPSGVALAAIQFILAGGHYYPHSVLQVRSLSSCATEGLVRSRSASHGPAMLPDDGWGADARPVPRNGSGRPGREAPSADASGAEGRLAMRFGDRTLMLTQRQLDVIRWLERGLSNKAIGKELELSESTVKLHVRHLLRKLGVSNRTQVALLARSAH